MAGLYAVESMDHRNRISGSKSFSANSEFNPNFIKIYGKNTFALKNDRCVIMDSALKMEYISMKNNIQCENYIKCVYNGWDCSPRSHGRMAYIDSKITEQQLINHYAKSVITSFDYHNETGIILNFAWNEWGEGAVMEPDTINGTMVGDCHKKVFGVSFENKEDYIKYLKSIIS
jgi:hypothetical protein